LDYFNNSNVSRTLTRTHTGDSTLVNRSSGEEISPSHQGLGLNLIERSNSPLSIRRSSSSVSSVSTLEHNLQNEID